VEETGVPGEKFDFVFDLSNFFLSNRQTEPDLHKTTRSGMKTKHEGNVKQQISGRSQLTTSVGLIFSTS
jgi:hypothetical protein